MEKRAAGSTKPPASSAAAASRTADAKRLAEKDANVAKSTTRPSTLSTRATGSTISKPPTRPIASARKTAGRDVDDASSTRSNDSSTRSAHSSTVGVSARTTRPPEPVTDKTRRTTVGGNAASLPPKRPLATSRASLASPTTDRARATQTPTTARAPPARTAKPPLSPAAASNKSTASAARPISRDAIPEEPEDLADIPDISSQIPGDGKHPPKLEIRSMNSSTPALKPQALSDNEGRPKWIPRHSRTQSAILPNRPMTAPMPPMNEQQQSMREMEVLSNLLRESTRRDVMASEIADLKSEIGKLERQNKTLTEAAAKSPVIKPQAIVEATEKKERELKVILRSQHLQEIESIKSSHKAALTSLEDHHAKELKTLRSELDSQRRASSHLVGVETRIEAVESALRESKQRASQSEQELQQKIQKKDEDKGKLGTVISDLRREIERCQLKLNEDVAKQSKEKKEAQRALESLKKELEAERVRLEEAVREKAGEAERTRVAVEEARKGVEPDVERLRSAAAKAEEASKKLKKEMAGLRKRHEEALEKEKTARVESADTITRLKADLEKQRDEGAATLAEHNSNRESDEKDTADLRSELEELQRLHQEELQEFETSRHEHDEIANALREKLEKLQQEGVDGSQVVEDLQRQVKEWRDAKAESEGRGSAAHEEVGKLRSVVEELERGSVDLKKRADEAVAAKDVERKRANELEEVGSRAQESAEALQGQLDEAVRDKVEAAEQLSSLQENVEAFRTELEGVRIEELMVELGNSRREAEETTKHLKTANVATDTAERGKAGLEREVEHLQQQLDEEREVKLEGKQKIEALLVEVQDLRPEVESLRLASEQRGGEVERERARAEGLERSLVEAEAARGSAASALESLGGEMRGLRKTLDEARAAGVEKEAQHVKAMDEQRREHGNELAGLRDQHAAVVAKGEEDGEAAADEKVAELDRALDSLRDEHVHAMDEQRREHEAELAGLRDQYGVAAAMRVDDEAAAAEREAEHSRSLEALRAEHIGVLDAQKQKHDEELTSLRDQHAEEAARTTVEGDTGAERDAEYTRALESLKAEHGKEIEGLRGKHKISTYDASEKYAAGEKVWRERLEAVEGEKEALARTLAEIASGDEGLEGELEGEREVSAGLRQRVQELGIQTTAQAKKYEGAMEKVKAELEAVRVEHETTLRGLSQSLSDQHEHNVQAVMDKHAQQIAEIEEAASRRAEESGRERDRVHEVALARLEAEHAEMLREALHVPVDLDAGVIGEREKMEEEKNEVVPETPAGGKGLSHVFVNREAVSLEREPEPTVAENIDADGDGHGAENLPQLAETPLAYASEEEKDYSFIASPTPCAEKVMKSSPGAHLQATHRRRRHDLEKRNAELEALLERAREELAELKGSHGPAMTNGVDEDQQKSLSPRMQDRDVQSPRDPTTAEPRQAPPTTPSRPPTNSHHASPLSQAHSNLQNSPLDPFTSSAAFSPRNSTTFSPSSPSKWREAPMTLEGTLESIRVQTEQLLEINEDFITEQRRWGRRRSGGGGGGRSLGGRRSLGGGRGLGIGS
ncbi:hypothetical protein LTR86_000062 [Recurvomyces mirabilis]|nr:hypothetical protein LTR86_000062 [Recurvomyces mirabilis]